MKNAILLIAAIIFTIQASAQDTLTRTNGDQISCHIIRIGHRRIEYKLEDEQSTAMHIISKKYIANIRYENGKKTVFHEVLIDDNDPEGRWDKTSMSRRGREDANQHYRGYRGAAAGTFWTCVLATPLLGLIPAIGTSSHAPKAIALNSPDPELMKNEEYKKAYEKEARRKKTRAVWGAWVGGFFVSTAITIVIIVL